MQNYTSASRTSKSGSEVAASAQAPKTPQDKVGNETLSQRLALQSVEPAALPEVGVGETECHDYVVLARGNDATAGSLTMHAARVSVCASVWEHALEAGAVRLATDKGVNVVELIWPGEWGSSPKTRTVGQSLQPIDARLAVDTARESKGWSKATSSGAVENLLAGETNQLSAAAIGSFRGDVSSGAFKGKSDTDQATFLDGLLASDAARTAVVAEPVSATAKKVTRGGPTLEKDHDFEGDKADANVYTLTFEDAQVIKVYVPATMDPKMAWHSIDQIEEAVSKLPDASRKVASAVTMNTIENPDDAHWAVAYNTPDFHSYMTAGEDGSVTIYPDDTGKMPSQDYMNGTMIHETGHTWAYKQWGTDNTKGGWVKWQAAMDSDKASPSNYATNAIEEDVAEAIQLYGSTKGKPTYDEYKAILPARFAILEAEMK
ncbi:MAG: hypothetical protein V4850_24440 [Myxococcota bacterium]